MDINNLLKTFHTIVPNEKFNKELEFETQALQGYMRSGDFKGIMPKLIVKGFSKDMKQSTIVVGLIIDGNDDDFRKYKYMALRESGKKIALEMKDFMPTMVFFHSEAWIKMFTDGTKMEDVKDSNIQASDFPDKQEVAMVAGMTLDRRCNMSSVNIIRTGENNIILGVKPQYMPYKGEGNSPVNNILNEFFIGYLQGLTQKISERREKEAMEVLDRIQEKEKEKEERKLYVN